MVSIVSGNQTEREAAERGNYLSIAKPFRLPHEVLSVLWIQVVASTIQFMTHVNSTTICIFLKFKQVGAGTQGATVIRKFLSS